MESLFQATVWRRLRNLLADARNRSSIREPAERSSAQRTLEIGITLGDDLDPRPIPGPASESRERATFLGRALGAARGILGGTPERKDGGAPSLDEIIQDAFSSLAREVAAEHGVAQTLEGLQAVEDALAAAAPNPEDDEAAYWSAVFKLGAFGGELIRASNGGRWVQIERGNLPFALATRFRGGQATVNPLGKAIKLFADGKGESVAALVRVTIDSR